MKKKKWLVNILILFVSVFIALFVGELAFRAVIFSGSEIFKNLRNPENYASSNNESDYWKLSYKFGGEYKPPKNPHPLLGWIGYFDRETLVHNDAGKINNRRPVILYGDSYAQCVAEALCFEDFLNNDSTFLKEHYFLNYGVGGYGVDQIFLLYKNTIDKFEKPFVVFSLMNYDIDRSILSVRTGQKPYFEIENDSLVLHGTPINQNPEEFFEENPIKIKSLLFRKFLYSKLNFLPDWLTSYYKGENKIKEKKKQINSKILETVVKDLRQRNIDFVFLIFHYILEEKSMYHIDYEGWRDEFIRDFLQKKSIPYIWSKDVIRKDTAYSEYDTEKYMIPNNGHPTSHMNQLISDEIKKVIDVD